MQVEIKIDSSCTEPRLIILTASMTEEVSEYNSIMTDIQTYVDEFKLKFILGTEPLENYPVFVENIKNMNIDRAIEIRQAEYNRYLER